MAFESALDASFHSLVPIQNKPTLIAPGEISVPAFVYVHYLALLVNGATGGTRTPTPEGTAF